MSLKDDLDRLALGALRAVSNPLDKEKMMADSLTQHQFHQALESGNYRWSDRLQSWEIALLIKQADAGMRTTNGDTAPVTLTARQFYILLRAVVLGESCMAPKV